MYFLSFFVSFSLCTLPIPLDDNYHKGIYLEDKQEQTYIVQGNKDEAALLLVAPKYTQIGVQVREYTKTEFTNVSTSNSARENDYETRKIQHPSNDPFYLKLICENVTGCPYTIRNVHTDPVYRISAVLGAFSLFVCLFLLVFSWTIFCGACRAERKR